LPTGLDMVPSMSGMVVQLDTASVLSRYRSAVDETVTELSLLPANPAAASVAALVGCGLQHHDVAGVLAQAPGGVQRVIEQAVDEHQRFRPSVASNAASAAALVRILLLQQIDLAWWAEAPDFALADDVARSPALVDLREARSAGGVRFGFGVASDRLHRRVRDYAVQRARPSWEPRGPGLPFVRARPEMVALLNEVADAVALAAPANTPRLWVSSIVRSVAHQQRLRSLGYSALLPSAHCRGWAADIEMWWFDRFGASAALRGVLQQYLHAGVLNVIDEGRAWHVCLAPTATSRYAAAQQLDRPTRRLKLWP